MGMSRQQVVEREISVGERRFCVRAKLYIVTDPCYGQDADGNRGVSVDFVDDVEYLCIFENGKIWKFDDLPEDVRDVIDYVISE
jgi:hypothetical protein